MEVHKDFAKRAKAIADSTPREVITALLQVLVPPEPLKVKAPAKFLEQSDEELLRELMESPPEFQPVGRDPFIKLYGGRRKRAPRRAASTYRVVKIPPQARGWRGAMYDIASRENNTDAAQRLLSVRYPNYADRIIDWPWLERQGIIEFI
jgi:hypothetical protein